MSTPAVATIQLEAAANPTPVRPRRRRVRRFNHWAFRVPKDYVIFPRRHALGYLRETRLIEAAKNGDIAARNEMWLQKARLTLTIINKFKSVPDHMMADALQEGSMGLLRAMELYKIDFNYEFSTYAGHWIFNSVRRYLQRNRPLVRPPHYLAELYHEFRREMAAAHELWQQAEIYDSWRSRNPKRFRLLLRYHQTTDPLPIHLVDSDSYPVVEERYYDDSPSAWVMCKAACETLEPRELHIITRRFGFHGQPEATLKEIGEEIGLTRERVRQIEAESFAKLQTYLRTHYPWLDIADATEEAKPHDQI